MVQKQFNVYLAYNRQDQSAVTRIAERLKQAGLDPWFDGWCVTPGGRWQEELANGLRASASCAVFLGPSNLGDWEREELGVALDRAAKEPSFRLFLVLLPGLSEPFDPNVLSPFLSTRTWVDLRAGIENPRRFQSLINAIKGIPLGWDESVKPQPSICPYRGLQPFDEEHARFFFGRDGDTQRLVEELKGQRFLSVIGPSGSGKSSLVRAGLIPAIRQGGLPESERWTITVFAPGGHPLTALAALILRLHGSGSMQETLDRMTTDERALHLAASLALAERRPAERLVLVIDQFEELFTLCEDEHERKQFIANLLYASSIPQGRTMVVLTMRADFYPKCATYPEFSGRLAAHQFLVSPMATEGLRQCIEEPARQVELEFEEGLVETILKDVSAEPGALPLLEHALFQLWEQRRGYMLTLEAYQENGRIEGAIAKRAEAIYDRFNVSQRNIVKRLMLRLTQPGEGTEDTRRRALMSQLLTHPDQQEPIEHVVNALTDARLLTTGTDEALSDEPPIEVSHEALIRGWPRLRQWIEDDRAGLREHHRLTEAAQDWEQSGRNDSLLYRGLRLAQASEWRKENEARLNRSERDFLDLSGELEEQERRAARRRVRIAIGGLSLGIVLITAASLMAFRERQLAEEQRDAALSRKLAADAVAQMPIDPELGLLLAREAVQRAETREAEEALKRALFESRVRAVLSGHEGEVWYTTFSPDGQRVVTVSDDRTARVWETATGKQVVVVQHHGSVTGVVFSPDSKWFATRSTDKTARVWETDTGKPVATLRGHKAAVVRVEFSPDGQRMATTSRDRTARVWEVSTSRTLVTLKQHTGGVTAASFSPDGKRIVTSSLDNTARVWDANTGEVLLALRGHTGKLWRAGFNASGKLIVTASDDRTARVWDAETGKTRAVLQGHFDVVGNAAFSPDGRYVVTASNDGTARVWEAETGDPSAVLLGHSGVVYTAAFSHDSKWIVTASFDGTARVWDRYTGKSVDVLRGHTGRVTSAAFSPDGKLVVTTGRDRTARLWEVSAGQTKAVLRGHAGEVYTASFSPDSETIVTASRDGSGRIWELASESSLTELRGHENAVSSADFSSDGKWVITSSLDGTAWLWDAATGKNVGVFRGHQGPIYRAVFSPDAKWIATASKDQTVRIWEVPTQRSVKVLKGHEGPVQDVSFGPDSTLVVTAGEDRTARVWDRSTGRTLKKLEGHVDWVNAAAFSPDGRRIVTASVDKTARIWDVVSGESLTELRGHTARVYSAVFSPDGHWVATGSEDGTARLWDALTGRSMFEFRGHAGPVNHVTFSPNGEFVLTAGDDRTARVYAYEISDSVRDLMALASKRLTRHFSPEERHKYLLEIENRGFLARLYKLTAR